MHTAIGLSSGFCGWTVAGKTRGMHIKRMTLNRPKAASEILDLGDASRLLGHTDKRITETVYRRVEEIVKPTR